MKPFAAIAAGLLVATAAAATEERYDHRGSLGILVAGTFERKDSATTSGGGDGGWRGGAEIGGTLAVGGDGNDLKLSIRALFGGPFDLGIYAGYRGYFAIDRWKTFFELDLASHFTPRVVPGPSGEGPLATVGPRVGIGVQFDFLPIAGTYAVLGGQIGFGDGIRYGAELMIGFHFRSYLLE